MELLIFHFKGTIGNPFLSIMFENAEGIDFKYIICFNVLNNIPTLLKLGRGELFFKCNMRQKRIRALQKIYQANLE